MSWSHWRQCRYSVYWCNESRGWPKKPTHVLKSFGNLTYKLITASQTGVPFPSKIFMFDFHGIPPILR